MANNIQSFVEDFSYDTEEAAWVSDSMPFSQDIYMTMTLTRPGKVVIRQSGDGEKWERVPLKRHKDTSSFQFRFDIREPMNIRVYTSTQPKEAKYAYI